MLPGGRHARRQAAPSAPGSQRDRRLPRVALGLALALSAAAACDDAGEAATPPASAALAAADPDVREVTTVEDGGLSVTAREVRAADGTWVLDGPFEERYPGGALRTRGTYRGGVRAGVWESRYEDGTEESRGAYLEGEEEGVWIHRRPDGVVDMELTGVYEEGVRVRDWWEEGIRVGELRSGVTQHSEYRHGLRNGRAMGFWPDGGRESVGLYADGLRTGAWIFWREDGSVDEERTGYYEDHDRARALEPDELAALLEEVGR